MEADRSSRFLPRRDGNWSRFRRFSARMSVPSRLRNVPGVARISTPAPLEQPARGQSSSSQLDYPVFSQFSESFCLAAAWIV